MLIGMARFAADAPESLRLRAAPRATTLGRLLARIDGDAFDQAIGAWLGR